MNTHDSPLEMLSIPIEETSRTSIDQALGHYQGRRSAGIITSDDVLRLASAAEEMLDIANVPAESREGATYRYAHAGPTARAYKYARSTTQITLRHDAKYWCLVSVETVKKYPRQRATSELRPPPTETSAAF